MGKTVPITLRKPPKADMSAVDAFVRGVDNKSQAQQVTSVTSHTRDKSTSQHSAAVEEFKRATYYLRHDQIRALKLRAVTDDRNLSAVVREAIDTYLAEFESVTR